MKNSCSPVGIPSKVSQLDLFDKSVEPPITNRGVNQPVGIYVGIDWIQGTFPLSGVEKMKACLTRWFGGVPVSDKVVSFRGFDFCWGLINGVLLSWDPESPWAFVRVPGSAFDWIDQLSAFALLRDFTDAGLKLTRIDLFRDDYDRRVHPSEFFSLCKQGCLRGKRAYGYHESFDGKDRGSTLTLGRRGDRGDGCYARYYDKSQHAADRALCYRLEIEFSGEKARGVGRILSANPGGGIDDLPQTVEEILLGQFFFIEDGSLSRSRQYKFHERWSLYIGGCGSLRIAKPSKPADLQRTVVSFVTQWGGFLSGLSSLGLRAVVGLLSKAIRDASSRGFGSSINRKGKRINRSVAVGLSVFEVKDVLRIVGGGEGMPDLGQSILLSASGAAPIS